jgi:hypothetical protein
MRSLWERPTTLPTSNCASERHNTAVGGRHEESAVTRTIEQAIRKCLVCRSSFLSAWAGERVCRRCKDTAAWRSGAIK